MEGLLDPLLFLARVVLVVYCARHLLYVLTGTARTYAEWSAGFGGFLYLAGVLTLLLHLENVIPGRDISRVMNAVGFAFIVLPTVLHWFAPRLYHRLTQPEGC